MFLPISVLASTFSVIAVITVAAATPATIYPRSNCTNPNIRKEWRKLSRSEQVNYVEAVNCLTTKPSRIGLQSTLYDDFPYVHNQLNNEIHSVASFLPWHRYFVHVYEGALKECGYKGSATYWDWTLDALSPSTSSIWDGSIGFGGNGSPFVTEPQEGSPRKCVTDGPFKTLRPHWITSGSQQHCLSRSWNNGSDEVGQMLGEFYSPEVVDGVQATPNYIQYRSTLEGGPHGAIHSAIGGDMGPATSPNDPIFFLHHTQIDRLWYLWQQEDPRKRLSEYGGIRTQDQFDGVIPPEAMVEDWLPMRGVADDLQVKDLLLTESNLLCYSY